MTVKDLYGIYGASGYGREVMPVARDTLFNKPKDSFELVFVDDYCKSEIINNCKVLSFDSFMSHPSRNKFISIAISNYQIRESLFSKIEKIKINQWSIVSPNSVIMDNCSVGVGSILSPFTTLTSNITIGKSFHANIYSYIAHDSVIGDFVTFAPAVKCNGNVSIGDNVYIGTGAIIKQGSKSKPLTIGSNSVIAAGSFVTKNIPEGVKVFGSPAKLLTRENLRKNR